MSNHKYITAKEHDELAKESKTTLSCHLHATSHIHGDKNAIIASVGKKGIRNRSEVYSKSLSNDYSKNKLVYKDDKNLANKYRTQKRGLMQKLLSGEWQLNPKEEKQ